jgi:hypothetical protein
MGTVPNVPNIYGLSKSAKLTWGLRNKVLRTIYEGAILPLIMYGAPVWEDAMKYDGNRKNTRERKE